MGKGLIRSQTRASTDSGKVKPIEGRCGRLAEPSACERCGAVFSRRVWHRGAAVSHLVLSRAHWTVCPACQEGDQQEYHGRILIDLTAAPGQESVIRRRIVNVAERAGTTQPERRLVSIERQDDTIEVLTSSQRLAHRIVHELKKVCGGHATYAWSEDRSLFARWSPRTPAASRTARR